jgi:hypothetical protein
MKTSTRALGLILGGGLSAVAVFAGTAFGALPEKLAGLLMAAGILLAMWGCVMLARRQVSPWSRAWRSRTR